MWTHAGTGLNRGSGPEFPLTLRGAGRGVKHNELTQFEDKVQAVTFPFGARQGEKHELFTLVPKIWPIRCLLWLRLYLHMMRDL